jgi:[glutamine synthetase] adenylyltransferase / [glutamine synthetase]-adenylyl-L-tyrosine phosphorylase
MSLQSDQPFAQQVVGAPLPFDVPSAERDFAELCVALPEHAALFAQSACHKLLLGVLGSSPYLAALIKRNPAGLARMLTTPPEWLFTELMSELAVQAREASDIMQALRHFKNAVALLTALADLGGVWPVMTVTRVLAEAADAAVQASIHHLFRRAVIRGDWLDQEPAPEARSGYMVIAMGKHGAFELNYSSDIDLIVFYDAAKSRLRDGLELQTFFVRLTRDLVRLMQERTGDGYVFRTDLRLRPDPGATPVALSTDAALQYYESFGQNWERAALIKARAIAGDLDAGNQLIDGLVPFIWRKYLDFAAIADIHAMKRQIQAFKGFGTIAVAGHNIKLGRGGIREIEFFAQTQQLIAGGRQRDLRIPATLAALDKLAERAWILPNVAVELRGAYEYLRRIEHRLQMISDEQTQTLPSETDALTRLANFSGYPNIAEFSIALTEQLETVQSHYVRLFEQSPTLTAGGASMVFAGEADDPATVTALGKLGFSEPSVIIAAVRGWHHGRYPAIRTPRARELLTEVQPLLIEAFAKTIDPQRAFLGFDVFLSELPSGVQLFSLLKQNPGLLDLVAQIMGTAPRLARVLGKSRRVLDAVLDPGFFGTLNSAESLRRIFESEFGLAPEFQAFLDRTRVVGGEQAFLIGVRVLTGTIGPESAGGAYAMLADHLIDAAARRVESEIVRAHGHVANGHFAVIAMGKLGGQEMTASSDLDLIVIYDFDPEMTQSDGPRPLAPTQYYGRMTQRLISAFTAPTSEGTLYEVDMRLRPSGQKGPVATQLSSFIEYQNKEAWTWEHLALTRARVVSGSPAFAARVDAAIRAVLLRPRDRAKIAADVRDMRSLIAAEKGATDLWDLKQVRGGLVDLEFIAQYLQLIHAASHPQVLSQNTATSFKRLAEVGAISPDVADRLAEAAHLLHNLTQILRLCINEKFDPEKAPDGLKLLLARAGNVPDFRTLEAHLRAKTSDVAALFELLVA